MTRLFGKKNKQTTIAELEEYYANQNQKKNRTWKPWLMAFLSLLITVAIILALFLGGRWLYRTFVDGDNGGDTTTTTDNNGVTINLPSFDGDFDRNETSGDIGDDSLNGSSPLTNSEGGVVSDEAASTDESNEDRLVILGGSEELPSTGAGELIVLLPIFVASIGYLVAIRHHAK